MRVLAVVLLFVLGPIMAFKPLDKTVDQKPPSNDTVKLADTFSKYLSECVPTGWSFEVIKESPERPMYYKQPVFIIKYWMEVIADSTEELTVVQRLQKKERTHINLYFYFRDDPKLTEQEIELKQRSQYYGIKEEVPKRLTNSKDLTCFYEGKVYFKDEEQEKIVVPMYFDLKKCLKQVIEIL